MTDARAINRTSLNRKYQFLQRADIIAILVLFYHIVFIYRAQGKDINPQTSWYNQGKIINAPMTRHKVDIPVHLHKSRRMRVPLESGVVYARA